MNTPVAIVVTIEPAGELIKWSVSVDSRDKNGRPVDAKPTTGHAVGLAEAHDQARDVSVILWRQMKRAQMEGTER